jgi:hypothetical protein
MPRSARFIASGAVAGALGVLLEALGLLLVIFGVYAAVVVVLERFRFGRAG